VPLKKRKILCSAEDPAKEFVSADFCAKNEKLLVTMSAKSEARVIIWNWDKQRVISFIDLHIPRHHSVEQVSFSTVDPSVVVITGEETYLFYKLDGSNFKIQHSKLNIRETDEHLSKNYTCHAWLHDSRFVICNDQGQIFLLDQHGEFKGITIGDPRKDPFPITAITVFSGVSNEAAGGAAAGQANKQKGQSGFIVAGESGRIRVFVRSDSDPKKPFARVDTSDDLFPAPEHYLKDKDSAVVYNDIDIQKTTAISLSPSEDVIVFTTSNNQIIKVPIELERPNGDQRYEHLISSFHSKQIHGLDVCIKKELVATCSSDRTVRLWSYTTQNMFR